MSSASALIGQLGQLVSPGPGFDTVNRLGEAADTETGECDKCDLTEDSPHPSHATDSGPGGLPQPGTLEHTVTLGLFRLQQSLNQAALKLGEGPESLLQEGYSLLTGQPVATDKLGQVAQTSPSVSYSTLTNVNPTSVALGVLATGNSHVNNTALGTP